VTHLSLPFDPVSAPMPCANFAAVFYGLGSDGTVSANKNSIKIIGDETELYAQGYFVYDSKKSGAMTVSHLRFGPQPIRSAYLTGEGDAASSPATSRCSSTPTTCSPMPRRAVFLLNTDIPPEQVWPPAGPGPAATDRQAHPLLRHRRLQGGAGGRHGAAHQYRDADLLLRHFRHPARGEAIAAIKHAVEKTYGRKAGASPNSTTRPSTRRWPACTRGTARHRERRRDIQCLAGRR
jgi:pyruvate-ferredoxin/flavodoxin oxidoreductase